MLENLCFKIGDALVGEAEVGSGSFESFLEFAVLLGELLDSPLESALLCDEHLDGLAGDHLTAVADLAHEFADVLTLREDFLRARLSSASAFRARSRQVASIRSCSSAAAWSWRLRLSAMALFTRLRASKFS